MPTPADHLAAHVGRAMAGDDPSADRLRLAMAGESPGRFRDRLLLERAAHLVRTTHRTLEDIAADCGFPRYDVFARAFRRELGTLPSQWRADPTSPAIDAPGDVHVHPPDSLRLPARSRMDSVDLVVEMAEHHAGVVAGLVDAAARVPEVELDRPGDGGDTLRSALARAVRQLESFVARVHDTPDTTATGDDRSGDSLPALGERVAAAGPAFVDAVALLGATGRFDEAFVDAFTPSPVTLSFGTMVTRAVTDADGMLLLARTRLRACGVAADVRP